MQHVPLKRKGNTKIRQFGATTQVQYHDTVIVEFDESTITLQRDGWTTVSTKSRMNQASEEFNLGYCVYQRNWEWFVKYNGEDIPFTDGMTLHRAIKPRGKK